ncbi:MAG: HlyD family secretion protein [Dysgonomonas sp.]
MLEKKKDVDKIELRSEEFQEVLGSVPSWILRWGITIVALAIVILLIGSAIFKYPEIITAKIVLTGSTPPASIVAKTTGKLNELYISDNQHVKAGDFLGVIENSANTKDILILKDYLESIDLYSDTIFTLPPKHLKLGNLQSDYSSFYLTLFEYTEYKRLEYLSTKGEILKGRIRQYETQRNNLIKQKGIVFNQLSIARNQFRRDSTLNKKGIISNDEFEGANSQYLQSLLSFENICSSIDNAEIQIGQMKESLYDTNYQDIEKENKLITQLKTYVNQLQTEIQQWELNYVLIAPIDGEATFTKYWSINQNITGGDEILNIIPSNKVNLVGKASLPIAGSGRVEIGQKVNIRLDNFPDNEFGIIKGIVKNISLVPVTTNQTPEYTVEIDLPNELITTYKKELPYLPNMTGTADIITKDISVLERFIMPLRKALTEGMQ